MSLIPDCATIHWLCYDVLVVIVYHYTGDISALTSLKRLVPRILYHGKHGIYTHIYDLKAPAVEIGYFVETLFGKMSGMLRSRVLRVLRMCVLTQCFTPQSNSIIVLLAEPSDAFPLHPTGGPGDQTLISQTHVQYSHSTGAITETLDH